MDIPPEAAELAADFVRRNSIQIAEFAKRFLKGASDQVKLRLPSTYKTYLTTAGDKFGKAKSFFIRNEPTNIYNFYVPLGVSLGNNKIPKATYAEVVALATRAAVTGAAGSGKSVLMRHLFLSALEDASKVPIFAELRNLNTGKITVNSLIATALRDNGFDVDDTYISKAVVTGHFAILLDGYDEVDHSLRKKVEREILALSKRAPTCTIIVSSRPDDIFSGWENFSSVQINPLNEEQAAELIAKLPYDEDLKNKFVTALRDRLFENHESFLSNPLLLSIMLLTYGMSADIPTKLCIFYNQAYEALFQRHDALKAGFQRDRLTDLDIQDFSKVFAAFCVQTYDRRLFQFSRLEALEFIVSRLEALEFIEKAKISTGVQFNNEDFLDDALQAVCLLIEDGLFLVFAHRSFQEYFVARFMGDAVPEIQRRLIKRYSKNIGGDSVFDLLYELEPDFVEREFFIPTLNELFYKIGVRRRVGITHLVRYMKYRFTHFTFDRTPDGAEVLAFVRGTTLTFRIFSRC